MGGNPGKKKGVRFEEREGGREEEGDTERKVLYVFLFPYITKPHIPYLERIDSLHSLFHMGSPADKFHPSLSINKVKYRLPVKNSGAIGRRKTYIYI